MENCVLHRSEIKPFEITKIRKHYFIDFGKAYFGTIKLKTDIFPPGTILEVTLGEKLVSPNTIDKTPLGSVCCQEIMMTVHNDSSWQTLKIPANKRNTGPFAIKMPHLIGKVMPFRYCEIENATAKISVDDIRQIAVHAPFDDAASAFTSSDPILNQIYDLCKHTIKATTFCGVYVDGERERIPYEADAYINQISHSCVDADYTVAKRTIEHFLLNSTWPTEWILHVVPMAWAYYEMSGDIEFIKSNYDKLCAKTLSFLARKDGLISTCNGELTDALMDSVKYGQTTRNFFKCSIRDIVDWPPGSFTENGTGERDNHEMLVYNTVVNAFYYWNLILMARIASALNLDNEAFCWTEKAKHVHRAFNHCFFDSDYGIYKDGEGGNHSSLHANMFPLAFDLVPENKKKSVVDFVKSRGMACSVYAAQYLLKALYKSGEASYALSLITAQTDRSWWNMIQAGSTMTWEAWDWKYKNNLDWNHAWGTAPLNIIANDLMGIQVISPGCKEVLIKPQIGELEYASIKFPTPYGAIHLKVQQSSNEYKIDVEAPKCIKSKISLPENLQKKIFLNGKELG